MLARRWIGLLLPLVALAPLARGERRIVAIVPRDLGRLAGRVVTASGDPVVRASVGIESADSVSEAECTDRDGRFRLEDVAADEVALVVQAQGFPAARVPRQRVGDTDVEVVLASGREVRIVVVGARGEPVSGASVAPRRTRDAWWNGPVADRGPGEFVVADAPFGAVAFDVIFGGRRIPGEVPADADSARVELPPVQECTFELVGAVDVLDDASSARVDVRGLDAAVPSGLSQRIPMGARAVSFPSVFPGRYEAVVRTSDSGTTLSEPVVFEVSPDASATVRIELRRP